MPARRHHYVPQFLLRRFSCNPSEGNPEIWRLDRKSGKRDKSRVRDEAFEKNFYRVEGVPSLVPDEVEARVLAVVDDHAARAIRKMVDGSSLALDERRSLAIFIWLLRERSPLGREQRVFYRQQEIRLQLISLIAQSTEFDVQEYFRLRGEDMSLNEAQSLRRQMIQSLAEDRVDIRISNDAEIGEMLRHAGTGQQLITFEMSWIGLRPMSNSRFILSDHPLAFYDSSLGTHQPASWQSSAHVQVTLPLDPSFCLLLIPGPPGYEERSVDNRSVDDINLRTYAWGHWYIYGPTTALLQEVRSKAKRNGHRVVQVGPKKPGVEIELVEGNSRVSRKTSLGTNKAARPRSRRRQKRMTMVGPASNDSLRRDCDEARFEDHTPADGQTKTQDGILTPLESTSQPEARRDWS